MKIITQALLNTTTEKAKASERLRRNYNFHEDLNEPIHRMLNAMEPGTYVQPHKHEKIESIILLQGKLYIFIFDNYGNVTEKIELSQESGNIGIEIPQHLFHTIVIIESGTIIYEVKEGPYTPLDESNFAKWAPKADDKLCAEKYINTLINL